MSTRANLLETHHDQIIAWSKEPHSLRDIAGYLQKLGVDVDHNAVGRYCKTKGIILTPKSQTQTTFLPKTHPPQQPPAATAPPAAPKTQTPLPSQPKPKPAPQPKPPKQVAPSLPPSESELDSDPEPPPPPPPPPKTSSKPKTVPPPSTTPPPSTSTPKPATSYSMSLGMPTLPSIPSEPVSPWRDPDLPFPKMPTPPIWTPDLPILEFGGQDAWTLRDAFEGVFIVGATGSGKTSGSGKTLAHALLASGFGGLILTVKPDERQLWEQYAQNVGRSHHLCIIEPGGPYTLNFLDYEARRPGARVGAIENITHLFQTLMEVYSRNASDSAGQEFWVNAGNQLLRNTLRILGLSRPSLSLEEIRRFIIEAPSNLEIARKGYWRETPFFGPCFEEALRIAPKTPFQSMIREAHRYWMNDFPALADKTRSCIITSFTALADGFFDPAIDELFCQKTTILPEAALDGALILVDLPIKKYGEVGLFAQSIWKYLFQKALERRADPDNASRRPVFLWIDEAQFFHSHYDALFQSTARSSRCATVNLTQNLCGFYGLMGGHRAKDKVDGFLGNLNTKIIHNNNDPATNEWAAQQIGKNLLYRFSSNIGSSTSTPGNNLWNNTPTSSTRNNSGGMQQVIDYEVQPVEFTQLRTGGPRNNFLIDAYFIQSGNRFNATGKHWFKTVFQQESRS